MVKTLISIIMFCLHQAIGRFTGAWILSHRVGDDFIIVEFERAVYPERIDIYETFNPGAIVKVCGRNGMLESSSMNVEIESNSK